MDGRSAYAESRLVGTRRSSRECGFTLIELMVVILIIGILIAIALPTYLGTRQRVSDRAAQQDIRTGLVSALTFWAESGSFDGFDTTEAEAVEPSLQWVAGASPQVREIAIAHAAGGDLVLITRSRSGTYFCIAQQPPNPATTRGKDADPANLDTVAECDGGW